MRRVINSCVQHLRPIRRALFPHFQMSSMATSFACGRRSGWAQSCPARMAGVTGHEAGVYRPGAFVTCRRWKS